MIGILLAGGRATRLGGGDKCLQQVAGATILERIVTRLAPQCDALALNVNGDPARFASLGLDIVPDSIAEQPGPLAGVLAGLDYAARVRPQAQFVVSIPTDTPFLPHDLVAELQDIRIADRAAIVCARSGGRPHFATALWSIALREDLRAALGQGQNTVRAFIERHPFAYADWPITPYDPFFNVNTPDDLEAAAQIALSYRR